MNTPWSFEIALSAVYRATSELFSSIFIRFLFNSDDEKHNFLHWKNDFAEVSKNLAKYRSERILSNHQNNYVGNSSMTSDTVKSFDWTF